MDWRKIFSYNESGEAIIYGSKPTTTPNVSLLIESKPYWPQPQTAKEQKQQTLILNDWTASSWTNLHFETIKIKLKQLLEQGFQIHYWYMGELQPLTENDINNLNRENFCRTNFPDSEQELIINTSKQLGLTHNQLRNLDSCWLNRIINDDPTLNSVLYTSNFAQLDLIQQEKILLMLSSNSEPFTKIILDELSINNLNAFKLLQQKFPSLDIEINLKKIDLTNIDCKNFFDNEIIEAFGEKYRLSEIEFDKVEHFKFGYLRSEDFKKYLNQLLKQASHIQSIHANLSKSRIKKIFAWKSFEDITNQSLLELKLDNVILHWPPPKSIISQKIIKALPKLQHLVGENSMFLFPNNNRASSFIKQEKELLLENPIPTVHQISEGTLTTEDFNYTSLSKVKSLAIHTGEIEKYKDALKESVANLGEVNVLKIIANMPDYGKSLMETAVNIRDFLKEIEYHKFSKVSDITIAQLEINTEDLRVLSEACPNLRELSCYGCETLSVDFTSLENNPFKNITKLSLGINDNTFKKSSNDFYKIIGHINNLKILNIDNSEILKQTLLNYPDALKNLTSLTLRDNSISSGDIQKLLESEYNIKKISLASIKKIKTSTQMQSTENASLEVLELFECDLDDACFVKLFFSAKNLKKLDLSGSTNIEKLIRLASFTATQKKSSSLLSQSQLEELNFGESTYALLDFISTEPDHLKKMAPNLRKLSCKRKVFYSDQYESCIDKLVKHFQEHPEEFIDEDDSALQEIIFVKKEVKEEVKEDLENPIHNPSLFKDFTPDIDMTDFVYKGDNHTLNQEMIIEKLCQYLTINQTHLDMRNIINRGICNALSHFFIDKYLPQWDKFINLVSVWDGTRDSLSEDLSDEFERLINYVKQYHYNIIANPQRNFVGDSIQLLLEQSPKKFIIHNPWHTIVVEPYQSTSSQWIIYDPNYKDGYKIVKSTNLIDEIHKSIGSLLITEEAISVTPSIDNFGEFIADGGLFILASASNAESILKEIRQSALNALSKQDLEGILLRNTKGKPAWLIALESPREHSIEFSNALLLEFINKSPNDYTQKLLNSLSALDDFAKHQAICQLIAKTTIAKENQAQIIESLRTQPLNKTLYSKRFETWHKEKTNHNNPQKYIHSLSNKHLIEVKHNSEISSLQLAIRDYCHSTSRPVFYANSPSDLICSAPYVKRGISNTGQIIEGPGGALYDFLIENKGSSPMIIVNYNNFDSEDIIKFNAMLDNTQQVDGMELPKNTSIIGLINPTKPDVYQGADFYSRFEKVEKCTFTEKDFKLKKLSLEQVSNIDPTVSNTIKINLYHQADWQQRLLGQWQLNNDNLTYQEGALITALKTKQPIEINNGLWQLDGFTDFWQQAINLGYVEYAGKRINLPANFKLYTSEGYNFTDSCRQITKAIKVSDTLKVEPEAHIINSSNFSQLFHIYKSNNKKLELYPGILAQAAKDQKSVVSLFISSNLTIEQWAQLLDESIKYGIKLDLQLATSVNLPNSLIAAIELHNQSKYLTPNTLNPVIELSVDNSVLDASAIVSPSKSTLLNSTEIIESTDIDSSVSLFKNMHPEKLWLEIDVSEMAASDLLTHLEAKFDKTKLAFEFDEQQQLLLNALEANQNIILKGHLSKSLSDELAALLIKRQQNQQAKGNLAIISQPNSFSYLSTTKREVISPQQKRKLLINAGLDKSIINNLSDEQVNKESLSQLKTRIHYIIVHRDSKQGDEAWYGLESIDAQINLPQEVDFEHCIELSQQFHAKRRQDIAQVLSKQPYVFISGLSGVGKSTFIEKELCDANQKLYLGENNLKLWALDKSSETKYLFIDEANLSQKKWSEFEGLYNTPPTIHIDGEIIKLSRQHKVIFAGNPLNYGDARTIAPLFKRHGNSIIFEPLSQEVIYQQILKPILNTKNLSTQQQQNIGQQILYAYRFICKCSTTEILISPRELQMMALMTSSYLCENPQSDVSAITNNFIYDIAIPLIPDNKQNDFDKLFKPNQAKASLVKPLKDFHLTNSRKPLAGQVHNLLKLREYRINGTNDAERYGGLGGIVIEGPPAVGKTELVIHSLIAEGYQEVHDLEKPSAYDKPFYRLPVSASVTEKEQILLKAFDEGAVVIVDELNSSPMMERLLNDLLMGKRPLKPGESLDDARPKKPGFLLIGTQNPPTMAGRRKPSTALARRLLKTELPEYPQQELVQILVEKGLVEAKATSLVQCYQKQLAYAKQNQLTPPPTFRKLLQVANELISNKPINDSVLSVRQSSTSTSTLPSAIEQTSSKSQIHHNVALGHSYHQKRAKAKSKSAPSANETSMAFDDDQQQKVLELQQKLKQLELQLKQIFKTDNPLISRVKKAQTKLQHAFDITQSKQTKSSTLLKNAIDRVENVVIAEIKTELEAIKTHTPKS